MQPRRAILLMAVVLGLAAVGAAVASIPQGRGQGGRGALPLEPPPPAVSRRAPGSEPVLVSFAPKRAGPPPTEAVRVGAQVVLTVEVDQPGEVILAGLGRIASAEPGTPAVFDVLAESGGRFDALFRPLQGAQRRVGTLVVE